MRKQTLMKNIQKMIVMKRNKLVRKRFPHKNRRSSRNRLPRRFKIPERLRQRK